MLKWLQMGFGGRERGRREIYFKCFPFLPRRTILASKEFLKVRCKTKRYSGFSRSEGSLKGKGLLVWALQIFCIRSQPLLLLLFCYSTWKKCDYILNIVTSFSVCNMFVEKNTGSWRQGWGFFSPTIPRYKKNFHASIIGSWRNEKKKKTALLQNLCFDDSK